MDDETAKGDAEMGDEAAHLVHRRAQALNDAIQAAAEAGYRVDVETATLQGMGQQRHDLVTVLVFKPIGPGR